jgi:hypothetical protein
VAGREDSHPWATSPLSLDEIRAAAAAHKELAPEYSDVVIESFLVIVGILWATAVAIAAFAYPVSNCRRKEHGIRQTGRQAP